MRHSIYTADAMTGRDTSPRAPRASNSRMPESLSRANGTSAGNGSDSSEARPKAVPGRAITLKQLEKSWLPRLVTMLTQHIKHRARNLRSRAVESGSWLELRFFHQCATILLGKGVMERRVMRNFFTRRRSSSGRSRTVHSGTSRGGMRRSSSRGTVEMALGALVVVALVLVLLRLVGLI